MNPLTTLEEKLVGFIEKHFIDFVGLKVILGQPRFIIPIRQATGKSCVLDVNTSSWFPIQP